MLPADFYDGGALLAFGEHKGSGMSMLIELTAGLVSEMGTSCDPEYLGGNGALIMALDIAAFVERRQYFDQADTFCREAKRLGGGPSSVISFCRASSRRAPSSAVGLEVCGPRALYVTRSPSWRRARCGRGGV